MLLEQAKRIADEVISKLRPHCERIEVAGSIRRGKSWVRDIDLVCIPISQGQFIAALRQLGPFKVGGQSIIRVDYHGASLDVYIAKPETWATLLLIRTGSAAHNVMLCKLAKSKGMKLHADGSGLFRFGGMIATDGAADGSLEEIRIAGDTEESIFTALGLKYKKPEERE